MQPVETPWWAVLTVWGVVNTLNLLQAVGFLSRIRKGNMVINHRIGMLVMALTVPAGLALFAFARSGSNWLFLAGPATFLAFVVLMLCVDYVWKIEFRSPMRYSIAAPYLTLFFGSIVLMGLPMFELNKYLWLVTAVTAVFLVSAMGMAMRKGVG